MPRKKRETITITKPAGNRHGPRGHRPKGWRESPLAGWEKVPKELGYRILRGESLLSIERETGVSDNTLRRIIASTIPRRETQEKLIKWVGN